MRFLLRLLLTLLVVGGLFALVLRLFYGGGSTRFPDVSGAPTLPESALQQVASLGTPPGNIAVAPNGRVFVSLHPLAKPGWHVVELVDGKMKPFPNAEFQGALDDVLGIRIDRQNRLWTISAGHHGLKPARLMAFDLASGLTEVDYRFPREVAGYGSHLNDLQVSADGRTVFIADASFFAETPALVVFDVKTLDSRRLLQGHFSVTAEKYIPVAGGRVMQLFGLIALRPGVDSIALSRDGRWLYYAPVTNRQLYRVRAAALEDRRLSPQDLALKVETYADKPMSAGISTDDAGGVLLTDVEHGAVLRLDESRKLTTLVRNPRLRWPDGLSFGPGGWLYVAPSALHQTVGRGSVAVLDHAPYPVLRFKPGVSAQAGH